MPKFHQTKKFKALKDKWYKKLEKSGFKDIEHNEETLTAYSTRFLNHPEYVWQLKSAYYSMCESFLQNHAFKSNYERIIWEYHTNGLGTRPISKLLTKVRRKKTHYLSVWKVIQNLQTIMKTMYLSTDEDENETVN